MLHLVLDVLLHALMLVDVLLPLHVEEDPGRHGDGDGILRLRLHTRGGKSCMSLCALHFSADELLAVGASEQPVSSCSRCDCALQKVSNSEGHEAGLAGSSCRADSALCWMGYKQRNLVL